MTGPRFSIGRFRTDLLLGAFALALGAVLAATASVAGRLSPGDLWGGLAASALASVPRAALALASFLGAGYTVVHALAPDRGEGLTKLEFGFLAWIIGLLVASQCFWLVGWLGLYRPGVLLALQVLGALLLIGVASRGLGGRTDQTDLKLGEQAPRLLLLALIGAVAGAYLTRTLGTREVHPDALQYHLGFPIWYLRSGGIVHFPTLVSSGRYLGADLLYGAVLTPADPLRIIPAKLLSWCFGGTAILGVFLTTRRLGATRQWGLVAALAMVTVPAIIHWGAAKNDLAVAGAALSALWLLAVALENREPRWSLWIGLCLGYAVTVKVPMLAIVPVVGLAVIWHFGIRSALWYSFGCLLPVIPWAWMAWSFQGTPLYSFFADRPEYMRKLWAVRSANGLTLTPGTLVRNAVPLLLDSNGRVPGNDSLGAPFLVAALLGLLGCFRKRAARVLYVAGAFFLVAGMLYSFERRCLNRYFLLAPAAVFPVACGWVSSRRTSPAWRAALPFAAAAVLMGVYLRGDTIFRALGHRSVVASIRNGGGTPNDTLARQLSLAREVEGSLAPGDVLLINDGMIYYLSAPFVNAHALHSAVFRYDRLDADGLARQLRAERVGAALIRKGISGIQPQLLKVLARFGVPIARQGRLTGYQMHWDPGETASSASR